MAILYRPMGRSVEERKKEHIRCCKLKQVSKSAVALHAAESKHEILFDETTILVRSDKKRHHLIREAIEIAKNPNNLNREDVFQLNYLWKTFFHPVNRTKLIENRPKPTTKQNKTYNW